MFFMLGARVNFSRNLTPDNDLDNGPTIFLLRTYLSSISLINFSLAAIVAEIMLADLLLAVMS